MRDEYERARKELAIPEKDFALVAPHRHAEVTRAIIHRFTSLGAVGLGASWWWESFTDQVWAVAPDEPLAYVSSYLLPDARYWFVAESWWPKKESAYWIYDATGAAIQRLLPECHHHEYYIVDRKMTWMLCENHHGVVIACGTIKLKELNQASLPPPVSVTPAADAPVARPPDAAGL